MSIREVYEKKMQAQLDEWKNRLDAFKEKADQEETNLQAVPASFFHILL